MTPSHMTPFQGGLMKPTVQRVLVYGDPESASVQQMVYKEHQANKKERTHRDPGRAPRCPAQPGLDPHYRSETAAPLPMALPDVLLCIPFYSNTSAGLLSCCKSPCAGPA
ncbi:hypothetical protein MHYP_G00073750 [Metynnis hypsauchen]